MDWGWAKPITDFRRPRQRPPLRLPLTCHLPVTLPLVVETFHPLTPHAALSPLLSPNLPSLVLSCFIQARPAEIYHLPHDIPLAWAVLPTPDPSRLATSGLMHVPSLMNPAYLLIW